MALEYLSPAAKPAPARRSPTPLPAGVLVAVALHFGMFSTYSLVMGSLARYVEQDPWAVLRWGALTLVACLTLLPARALLQRREDPTGAARPGWGVTVAAYILAAFGAGYLRSMLTPWALGDALDARQTWQFMLQLALPLLVVLLAIEFYLARRQARLHWLALSERLERDLAARRLELVAIDDQRRREAAHHLHGEVQSRLFMAWSLLKVSLGAASPETAHGNRVQASEQLKHLAAQGLGQARDLLGAADFDRPISLRVAELVERFGRVLPVTLDLAPTVQESESRLDLEGRRLAVLLLEEALLNAFRHASATRIRVSLRTELDQAASWLLLAVDDDGRGFAPELAPKGLGLGALRGELERAGGSLQVDSHPDHGTRLTVRLPVIRSEEEALA